MHIQRKPMEHACAKLSANVSYAHRAFTNDLFTPCALRIRKRHILSGGSQRGYAFGYTSLHPPLSSKTSASFRIYDAYILQICSVWPFSIIIFAGVPVPPRFSSCRDFSISCCSLPPGRIPAYPLSALSRTSFLMLLRLKPEPQAVDPFV